VRQTAQAGHGPATLAQGRDHPRDLVGVRGAERLLRADASLRRHDFRHLLGRHRLAGLSHDRSHTRVIVERQALAHQHAHQPADQFVAVAERHVALAHQPVRQLSGGGELRARKFGHALGVEGHSPHHPG